MSVSIDKLFGVHAKAMVVRGKRAEVLASNLANVDTPNYKAKDVDFKAALGQAQNSMAVKMQTTKAGHLDGGANGAGDLQVAYRNPLAPALDGNTVDAQVEQAEFAENAIQYQTSLQFLSSRISGLIRALKEE